MTTKIAIILIGVLLMAMIVESCVSSKVAEKSGSQLWAENCMRCHSIPPSSAYTNEEWGTIQTHMRTRAMLTEDEYKKILEFLQSEE
ncbi:MAG: cytochrome c [Cytophagaceae bacterium]|nr:cytochrome c [Cytophagaceae bacterium]